MCAQVYSYLITILLATAKYVCVCEHAQVGTLCEHACIMSNLSLKFYMVSLRQQKHLIMNIHVPHPFQLKCEPHQLSVD